MDSSASLVASKDPTVLFNQMHTLYRISRVNQACYDPKINTPLACESLEHCLMGIWARVYSSSSYDQAQEVLQELNSLPPQIKEHYKTSLEQANTREKITALARQRFSSVKTDLTKSFNPPSNVQTVNKMPLRMFWRKASTSDLSLDNLKTELDKFSLPDGLKTHYFSTLEKSENLQETAKNFASSLDQDVTTYSTPTIPIPSPNQPTESLNSLYKFWHAIEKKNYSSLTEGLKDVEEKMKAFPLHIQKIYLEELKFKKENNQLNTLEDLYTCIHEFAEDITSAYAITSTSAGDTGCPKLAEYKRTSDLLPHTCFFKYLSGQTEFECNRLYSEILEGSLSGPSPLPSWHVPQGAQLDLQAHTYTNHTGAITQFTPVQNEKLKKVFSHLATAYTERKDVTVDNESRLQTNIQNASTIGVFERIMGATNLSAFFERHYKNLTPTQKEQFWHKMGQVILLDFIGHLDRMIRIDDQGYGEDGNPLEQYVLFGEDSDLQEHQAISPCNFGNLMVRVEENEIVFYAIDNNLGDGNPTTLNTNLPWIHCEQDKTRYLEFLNHLFSQENPKKLITNHFRKALSVSIQEEGNPAAYEPVTRDLADENFILSIQNGMQFMGGHLAENVLPTWEQNQNIKNSFTNATFAEMIQKRLYAITQTK